MATLSDISKICNTSTATVSYVLSGKGDERRISAAMQQRIFAAAEQLGYMKSEGKRNTTPKIEIHWPTTHLEMAIPSLMNGLNSAISCESSPVDVNIQFYEPGHIENQTSLWSSSDKTAAVIVAATASDLKYLSTKKRHIPIVLLNRSLPGYSYVTIDHEEVGRIAAEHAISKGGDDIGLILTATSLNGMNLREQAIISTFQGKGIDLSGKAFYCMNNIDDGYELGCRIVRENTLRKVLLCSHDMVALGIMAALNESGIQVGTQVEVLAISSGLSRLFARCYPPLTVVDIKMEEITRRCVRMAIDLASNRTQETLGTIVHPSLICRQSSPMAEII